MRKGAKSSDWVEIYHTSSSIAAHKIADVVLAPEDVEALIHDASDHAYPAPATESGSFQLLVRADQVDKGKKLVADALKDGFLAADEGELV